MRRHDSAIYCPAPGQVHGSPGQRDGNALRASRGEHRQGRLSNIFSKTPQSGRRRHPSASADRPSPLPAYVSRPTRRTRPSPTASASALRNTPGPQNRAPTRRVSSGRWVGPCSPSARAMAWISWSRSSGTAGAGRIWPATRREGGPVPGRGGAARGHGPGAAAAGPGCAPPAPGAPHARWPPAPPAPPGLPDALPRAARPPRRSPRRHGPVRPRHQPAALPPRRPTPRRGPRSAGPWPRAPAPTSRACAPVPGPVPRRRRSRPAHHRPAHHRPARHRPAPRHRAVRRPSRPARTARAPGRSPGRRRRRPARARPRRAYQARGRPLLSAATAPGRGRRPRGGGRRRPAGPAPRRPARPVPPRRPPRRRRRPAGPPPRP